jgi:hypothetical protein
MRSCSDSERNSADRLAAGAPGELTLRKFFVEMPDERAGAAASRNARNDTNKVGEAGRIAIVLTIVGERRRPSQCFLSRDQLGAGFTLVFSRTVRSDGLSGRHQQTFRTTQQLRNFVRALLNHRVGPARLLTESQTLREPTQ